jgi:hypothetical protein
MAEQVEENEPISIIGIRGIAKLFGRAASHVRSSIELPKVFALDDNGREYWLQSDIEDLKAKREGR